MKGEWKEIGVVGVDSGTLMVGDPCYFVDDSWSENHFNTIMLNENNWYNPIKVQFDKAGEIGGMHEGKAVIFNSGLGDGVYPVEARKINIGTKKNPDWRIAEVRIRMLDDDGWTQEED